MLQEITSISVDTGEKWRFEQNGLVIEENVTRPEWENLGAFLKTANKAVQWWIGDWLNFGERKWGEMYTQALEATDYEAEGSLRNLAWVSRQYNLSCRHYKLSFTYYQEVASLPEEQRKYWLSYAEKNGLSKNDLRRAIKGGIKESTPLLEGDFSWLKDQEYKRAQEVLKPDYRNFLDRLMTDDQDPDTAELLARYEYDWMQKRCAELKRKWDGIDGKHKSPMFEYDDKKINGSVENKEYALS